MVQIPFTFPVILHGALIAQGIFAAVVLLFIQTNRPANRFLAALLLSFSLWLIDSFYRLSGIYQQDANFYFQPIYYSFAFGPLLYFYVRALTVPDFNFKLPQLLHFIPVLLQAGLYLFLFVSDYPTRLWFWLEVHSPITYPLEFALTLLLLLIYIFRSVRLLQQYRHWLEEQFSEFDRIHLDWLRLLLGAMGALALLWSIDLYMRLVLDWYLDHNFSELLMGGLILLVSIGAIRQSAIDRTGFVPKAVTPVDPDIDSALVARIKARMENAQDYLHPSLSLKDFSTHFPEPSRTISEHINHGLGCSFVDFVNGYRVAEVQRRIAIGELEQLTLLAIALEAGFNSKSTFNRVFKKQTGQSPTEYVRLLGKN